MAKMMRLTSNDPTPQTPTKDDVPAVDPTSPDSLLSHHSEPVIAPEYVRYRTYKRRFFGLVQLLLLNFSQVVSWDWIVFAPISTTSARFFRVSANDINWLSTAFLLSFVAVAPLVIFTLNRSGPKTSMIVSSALILVGNWIRYAGTRSSIFGVVMFGQILIGFSQAFVLAAPTRYSNLWFSSRGRVTATALASLANPLGAAIGELISPLWATDKSHIPTMMLYTSIISTAITVPALFLPKAPPTPPSALAAEPKLDFREALHILPKNISFWCILVAFTIYVAAFNATSTLINQIFEPYGFTETQAGIAGALLIFVGLLAAAVVSPIIDRTKKYVVTIKILVPIIAAALTALIFMPNTRTLAGPYIICAILGAASFSLLPCTLEYLALVTHPVAPEMTSTVVWAMGQLFGAVFILVMQALKGGWAGEPKDSLERALVFQAVLGWVAVPFVMFLGLGSLRGEEQAVGM